MRYDDRQIRNGLVGGNMTYGLIAEKLGHSFSKEIHSMLFDYDYELCEVSKENFDSFMKKREFKAINVTIPYKEMVIPYLDEISENSRKIGAVNTIVNKNNRLIGYNTDYLGLKDLIKRQNIEIKNKKVLILGSGGTSKTAFAVAESMGCSFVTRVSRKEGNGCITYERAVNEHSGADVIINTTPVGMYPVINVSPIDISCFPKLSGVVDVVYNPLKTKLVCDAQKMGINAVGGLYMLVSQAVRAAEKFLDTEVDNSEIERVYKDIYASKQNIVLTGMPGAGKTTIGKILAKKLGKEFVDTDELIVQREKKTIPQIFDEVGEKGFRKIESDVVSDLGTVQNSIISTGGGAVLNPINVEILKENGVIVFIDRDISSIVATKDRPLTSNRADLEKKYNERYPIYKNGCDLHIKIGNDAEQNAIKITEMIKEGCI